eukprot:scaffold559_cov190-Alexandrium_tamarense.AAC.61
MLNANNPFTEFEAPIIKHFWEKRSPIENFEEGNSSIKEAQLGCISCEDASNVVVLGDSDADDDDDDGDVTKNQTTPQVRRSGISMTIDAERVEVMTMSSI